MKHCVHCKVCELLLKNWMFEIKEKVKNRLLLMGVSVYCADTKGRLWLRGGGSRDSRVAAVGCCGRGPVLVGRCRARVVQALCLLTVDSRLDASCSSPPGGATSARCGQPGAVNTQRPYRPPYQVRRWGGGGRKNRPACLTWKMAFLYFR